MFSAGTSARTARTTVSPPTPESKTPIGSWLPGRPASVCAEIRVTIAVGPTACRFGVFPDELEESQGLSREAAIQLPDPGEQILGDLEVPFCDDAAHLPRQRSNNRSTCRGWFDI